ncbi:hypothetical protein C8R43DRAFT_961042 [Mycena crocata]|nr:hypothetical protein C8R43DRAFT_961042 [Mycena crocata]
MSQTIPELSSREILLLKPPRSTSPYNVEIGAIIVRFYFGINGCIIPGVACLPEFDDIMFIFKTAGPCDTQFGRQQFYFLKYDGCLERYQARATCTWVLERRRLCGYDMPREDLRVSTMLPNGSGNAQWVWKFDFFPLPVPTCSRYPPELICIPPSYYYKIACRTINFGDLKGHPAVLLPRGLQKIQENLEALLYGK